MRRMRPLLLIALCAPFFGVRAQLLPEFNMADTTVTECKGILLDSEEGPGGNLYGNNEDLVFTIDAGSQITLVFTPVFCLEQGYDFITFHLATGRTAHAAVDRDGRPRRLPAQLVEALQ